MNNGFPAAVWLIWLICSAVITMLTRNPYYLIILLLVARIVQRTCKQDDMPLNIPFWRIAIVILFFSVTFNLLLVHVGQTVLLTIPQNLWLIGGNLTLEAVIYGAINGLILITLLAIFSAFNAIVPTSELIRLTPKSMTNVGLILLIAMTYVPETRRHLARVREAQELRGHQLRGYKDWRPIVIPLLIGGMERAVNLAETMIARGYGSTVDTKQSSWIQIGLLFGLLSVVIGSVLVFWYEVAGWIALAGGILLIFGILIRSGSKSKTTTYRRQPWTWHDWLVVGLSLAAIIFVLIPIPFSSNMENTLFYTPYPRLEPPIFDMWVGVALLFLTAPAIIIRLK